MSAAAPWSVKGIDPKAREIAKDLARRSGMTLGEWLNTMIMDDEDDGVTPLPRRPHMAEMFERRGRSRRIDDAYDTDSLRAGRDPGRDETLQRVAASVDAIAGRLEAAERRSTVAIQGVDQAVAGLLRRLDGQDAQNEHYGRRIDDIAEELREGHKRLRKFEQEVGPRTVESFGKMETSVGALASRLYDIEERQRGGVNELRQRMDAVEKAAGPGLGSEAMAQVGARLDVAQAQTTEALKSLERSFAGLDQRLRTTEAQVEPEGVREAARFEKLAESLSRQVETNRAEMMRRLDTAETENRMERIERAVMSIGDQLKASETSSAQAVEAMGQEVLRIAKNLNGRMQQVETGGGGEQLAQFAQTLTEKLDRDMGRYAQTVEQRLMRADDQHAMAIEKLGGEITRISDRLADRIAQSERRSAQALEDIGDRLAKSSEKIEHRYDRASGELAERMRLSEERTARLLSEARDSLEARVLTPRAQPAPTPAPAPAPAPVRETPESGDWRAAAFPDEGFDVGDDGWSRDPLALDIEPSPFPAMGGAESALFEPIAEPEPTPTPSVDFADDVSFAPEIEAEATAQPIEPEPEAQAAPVTPGPFAGFGGADVSDALRATEPTPAADLDDDQDEFAAETEFVDPRALRAAAAAGRAASTRDTIEAARAVMTAPEPAPARKTFGLNLKRGGKSKLQERLDRQAAQDGSTVKKTLLASVTGMAVIGGLYATARLTGADALMLAGEERQPPQAEATVLAAMALTPTAAPADATPIAGDEASALYSQALGKLDAGDASGVEPLTQAAELGDVQAQLKLAGLYQTGESGVERDSEESRLWARRAAEGGDARGMHAYGMYLFDGVGGARNRPEALDWLLKAADRGLVDSQYNAARIYENGDEGIAPNPSEAYKWYLIAARSGDQQAKTAADRMAARVTASAKQTARAAAASFKSQAAV